MKYHGINVTCLLFWERSHGLSRIGTNPELSMGRLEILLRLTNLNDRCLVNVKSIQEPFQMIAISSSITAILDI
jgi:hypothetical protein